MADQPEEVDRNAGAVDHEIHENGDKRSPLLVETQINHADSAAAELFPAESVDPSVVTHYAVQSDAMLTAILYDGSVECFVRAQEWCPELRRVEMLHTLPPDSYLILPQATGDLICRPGHWLVKLGIYYCTLEQDFAESLFER